MLVAARCVDPMLTVAAAMANGRPAFVAPMDKRGEANEAKRQLAEPAFKQRSDHIALIGAYNAWAGALAAGGRRAAAELAGRCFLSDQVKGVGVLRTRVAQGVDVVGPCPLHAALLACLPLRAQG
jgi:ATP-dependent RNA helicase DHX57